MVNPHTRSVRLDDTTAYCLDYLIQTWGQDASTIIRHLIVKEANVTRGQYRKLLKEKE